MTATDREKGASAQSLRLERPSCDFCSQPAAVDAKTLQGPWAYMCKPCFSKRGIGLGVGRGSVIVTPSDKQLRVSLSLLPVWFLAALTPGRCYASFFGSGELTVFGRIFDPPDEIDRLLLTAVPDVRFVESFSVLSPRGEFGSESVTQMLPISEASFAEAQEAGWKFSRDQVISAASEHRKFLLLGVSLPVRLGHS